MDSPTRLSAVRFSPDVDGPKLAGVNPAEYGMLSHAVAFGQVAHCEGVEAHSNLYTVDTG
jgi:hypothetical protein